MASTTENDFLTELKNREYELPRAKAALALIDMALEHGGRSATSAALIILSLEADNWYKLSLIELVHLDPTYRAHADTVILGVAPCDFQPSTWLKRIDIDVTDKINQLHEKYKGLRS